MDKRSDKHGKNNNTLIIILVLIIVALGAAVLFLLNDKNEPVFKSEKTSENNISQEDDASENHNEDDSFKDIEKLGKVDSLEAAFDEFFGEKRAFERADPYNATIKDAVRPSGKSVEINFEEEHGEDTMKEMVDFLHYVKENDLLKEKERESTGEKDSDGYYIYDKKGEPVYYVISLKAYAPTDKGMNSPDETNSEWSINTEQIKDMDFSDKDKILSEIERYGEFE